MFVIKRSGEAQPVQVDKITKRISKLTYGLDPNTCNPSVISDRIIQEVLENGISTVELDRAAAEMAYSMRFVHPDYEVLATRIAASSLQKECMKKPFSTTVKTAGCLSQEQMAFVQEHAAELDQAIVHARDFSLKYMHLMELADYELMRDPATNKPLERVQHCLMRKAIASTSLDLERVLETYTQLSMDSGTLPLSRVSSTGLASFIAGKEEEAVVSGPVCTRNDEGCITCSS